MTARARRLSGSGPFTADQIRPGDPYELSDGHAIYTAPTGRDGGKRVAFGAEAIETDPDVEAAGVDTGFELEPKTLRAPDIAVGSIPDGPGWVKGQAPLLAVEYAGSGQDEDELNEKIGELLQHGTKLIWVVRLTGIPRVEVHRPGQNVDVRSRGELLAAEGILRNAVPVDALLDRDAAHEHTLRNLLQRKGYGALDDVRQAGREEGELGALRDILRRLASNRGLQVDRATAARIDRCTDREQLATWVERAAGATRLDDIFGR